MSEQRRPPAFQDLQPPPLYRAGIALRRGFLTGPSVTPEEEALRALILRADKDEGTAPRGIRATVARWFQLGK